MYHGVGLWTGRQGLSYRMLGVVRWMFATICHNKKKTSAVHVHLFLSLWLYSSNVRSPDRGNKAEILPPGAQWLSHNYIQRYIYSGNTALYNSRGDARVHTCLGGSRYLGGVTVLQMCEGKEKDSSGKCLRDRKWPAVSKTTRVASCIHASHHRNIVNLAPIKKFTRPARAIDVVKLQ